GLNMPFIANFGQIDPAVAYYAPTFAGTVYVTCDGRIVYSLPGKTAAASAVRLSRKTGRTHWSSAETPVGRHAPAQGRDPASSGVSYFLGSDTARWRSGLP